MATGESLRSLASQFRRGVATISKIIPDVCAAIWDTLEDKFMNFPTSTEEWKEVATAFEQRWGYPHCIGAVDGKHVKLQAPSNSGSLFFNYKNTFSLVLMAIADANCKFIWIDVGAFGRQSDSGIFTNCALGKALKLSPVS